MLKAELQRYEGFSQTVYQDTKGNLTVGTGHMDNRMTLNQSFSTKELDDLYKADVINAAKIAQKCVNNYLALGDVRQRVLLQLCFNLGNKIYEFKNMLADIEELEWSHAADELQNSEWYIEVGERGVETVFAMRMGYYLFESQ